MSRLVIPRAIFAPVRRRNLFPRIIEGARRGEDLHDGEILETVIEVGIAKQPSRLLKSTIESVVCRTLCWSNQSKWIQTS
jgi:hypothetical protein